MGRKVLYLSVALLLYLMICQHVRGQCTQPSFESRNVILSESSILTKSFPEGSVVTFDCLIGHVPVRNPDKPKPSKSVTCEGNQWTSLELSCTRKSCRSPPEVPNGKYEKTGILFGDKITVVCDKGYELAGLEKERWCRDQGWDGRDPVCEVVKCDDPPTIDNGQLEHQPLGSYDYSHVVFYKCNQGFILVGSPSLHCSEDGTFKPDPPKCLVFSDLCPKPEIPHLIRIVGKSPPYELGNYIKYKCQEDYIMKGESHIVCSAEGWKPEPPTCIAPCRRPVVKSDVTLKKEFSSQNIFRHGSKVTFECILGYEPVDSTVSKSVTCEESKWTELLLTCKVVKCGAPPTIENGQLEQQPLDSYNYSHAVSYKCNDGLILTGETKLRCSEDRTFKPDPPKCLESDETKANTGAGAGAGAGGGSLVLTVVGILLAFLI